MKTDIYANVINIILLLVVNEINHAYIKFHFSTKFGTVGIKNIKSMCMKRYFMIYVYIHEQIYVEVSNIYIYIRLFIYLSRVIAMCT